LFIHHNPLLKNSRKEKVLRPGVKPGLRPSGAKIWSWALPPSPRPQPTKKTI